MSQESLVLKHYPDMQRIEIFDTHHLATLKLIKCDNPLVFPIIDEAVRTGKITFKYLLSDAVHNTDDIETYQPSNLELVDGFQLSDRVMYQGAVFTIAYFNLDANPVTARIVHGAEEHVTELKYLSPAKFQGHSHHSLTTSPPADNETNKRKFKKDQKVYIKGKDRPYYFREYINKDYCTIARATNKKDSGFTVPVEDIYIPQPKEEGEHTGGSSSYYRVRVNHPTTPPNIPYSAECNDMIEALNMTFAEANIFKAIWRTAAARQGKGKKGNNAVYDAEKCMFFSERMLIAANEAEVDER